MRASIVAPERLTNITIQMPAPKASIAMQIYKNKVSKETCPTPNHFFMAVFEAGIIEFEKYYIQENERPTPADIEVAAHELPSTPDEGGQG